MEEVEEMAARAEGVDEWVKVEAVDERVKVEGNGEEDFAPAERNRVYRTMSARF